METAANVPPLKIYVLWHRDFTGEDELPKSSEKGQSNVESLARGVVRLFQRTGTDLQEGLGIPVELRSVPFPQRSDNLPREIPKGGADTTVIVPLVDDTMMLDKAWERWLNGLSQTEQFSVLPVSITANAVRWQVSAETHAIHLFEKHVDERPKMLKRNLMFHCAKLLFENATPDGSTDPKLFISYHGEAHHPDGPEEQPFDGRTIGDTLYQIANDHYPGFAFFAHKSLISGVKYEPRIHEEVLQAAALISVFTAHYQERPWCRQEVRWAREPRRIMEDKDCWQITPLIVVDALTEDWSSTIHDFSGCPMIRWDKSRATEIVDRALIEAVVTAYHRRWAEKLAGALRVVISWVPDAVSLLKLRALGCLPKNSTVVYPGHGVTMAERRFVEATIDRVALRSYKELTSSYKPVDQHPLRDKLVSLSVSESEDLLVLGYSAEHLNDVCLQLARALLGRGASIAYGGVLGVGDFTRTLHESATYELDHHPSKDKQPDSIQTTPFVNYQPWPWYLNITNNQRAQETNTCDYVDVDDRKVPGPKSSEAGENERRAAHASSRMRRWMATDSHARIIVGGKNTKFGGLMPGILEEALFHLEARKPLYIVGGLGGAAGALAQAILRTHEDDALPDSLVKKTRVGNVPFDELCGAFPTVVSEKFKYDVSHDEAKESYDRLRRQVDRIRKEGFEKGLNNGLDDDENRSLMESENAKEIVRLVAKGLEAMM